MIFATNVPITAPIPVSIRPCPVHRITNPNGWPHDPYLYNEASLPVMLILLDCFTLEMRKLWHQELLSNSVVMTLDYATPYFVASGILQYYYSS